MTKPLTPSGAVLAIAAHPDDIEFFMAGTLLLLREAGWEVHCFNVGRGNLGSKTTNGKQTAAIRRREAQEAARRLGATWHPPIANDLEIFYNDALLRKVSAMVRRVKPRIVLTHSLDDYMEDHMITARLAVTAAFAREFTNYRTVPSIRPVDGPVTVYHAMPHMLRDPMGRRVVPEAFVNIGSVLKQKRLALAAHRSQKEWLDETQGMDSYLQTMEDLARDVGRMTRNLTYAEGWRRHLHVGFCDPGDDPLGQALKRCYRRNPKYIL